ncbi:MAG: virulence factor SrfC family protein [Hyphomicrobiaceae bacterium]
MTAVNERLVGLSGATEESAGRTTRWFGDNKDGIGAQARALQREFRRYGVLAQRLKRAASRQMCVGVFGESQSGKSYLISRLARPGTGPVMAVFGATELNFLSDLNPETGSQAEATGLVTRFTSRPTAAPAAHPVAVRLLSTTDLVKILANTYLLDFDLPVEKPPTVENIARVLSEARAAAARARTTQRPAAGDPLSEVDIDDLQQYFAKEFVGRATIRALDQADFWPQLEELAPALTNEDRVKLYELLWGCIPEFGDVYRKLSRAIEDLGFTDEAYCDLAALQPRERSVLNVETLMGLLKTTGDRIEVVGRNGRRARLLRPHLAAIVSELVIQLKEKPADYFDHTDLLDFPGLRTRLNIQISPQEFLHGKVDQGMQELFRRGKVAYLFDRYCAEQELTSMLLCIQPGNQNTRVLPPMVLKWIHTSQGHGPKERDGQETALFLVLTKFDMRFSETHGQTETSDELWTKAIEMPLVDFFGKDTDNWPAEWKTGRPFDNVFWLRNPGWLARGLMSYDEDKREVDVVHPDLARMKGEYLANPLIRRHVRDADRAWEAAFVLNDGGVTYLTQRLAPVCRPELKNTQIAARLAGLRAAMLRRIDEFYISDDGHAEAAKRKEAAEQAFIGLAHVAERLCFGHFLSALQIESARLQTLFYWMELKGGEGSQTAGTLTGPKAQAILERFRRGSKAADGGVQRADRSTRLAERALEHWADRLRDLLQHQERIDDLGIEAGALATVTRELLDGSRRLKLAEALAEDIRGVTQTFEAHPSGMLKPALAAAEAINGFVYKLGEDRLALARRIKAPNGNGGERPVFAERPRIDVLTHLPERGPVYFETFIDDWLASFLGLVDKNVAAGTGSFDRAQNARLGEIRRDLQGSGGRIGAA